MGIEITSLNSWPNRKSIRKIIRSGCLLSLLLWLMVLPLTAQTREEKVALARQTMDEAMVLYQKQDSASLESARKKFLTASRLLLENEEKNGGALSLVWAGTISNNLGQKRLALGYFNQALPLFQLIGEKRSEALTLGNIGFTYSELGEKPKALEYYNRVLPLIRSLGDQRGEAVTLNNIGLAYSDLGDYRKAFEYFNQSLTLRRAVGDKKGEAITLNNIGKVQSFLGEKQKALDYYTKSLELRRITGDKNGEGTSLNNIGKVYNDLNEPLKALEYLNQALTLFRLVGDKSGEVDGLNNLGTAYFALDEKQKALEHFNRALPLTRQIEDKNSEALMLHNLGAVYAALGQKDKALEFYRQSIILNREVGDRQGEATVLNNIGAIYTDLDENRESLGYYDQALPLFRVIGDKDGEATTLHNMMFAWDRLNNRKLAVFYGKQSVNLRQQLRSNIKGLPQSTQLAFLQSVENTYRSLADILISDGRFSEAQAVLDLIKEKEYEQLLRSEEKSETIPLSRAEAELLAKIDKLVVLRQSEIELLRQKQEQGAEFPAEKVKQLEQLKADLKRADTELEKDLTLFAKEDTSAEVPLTVTEREKTLQSALVYLEREVKTSAVALYTVIGSTNEKPVPPGQPLINQTGSRFGWVILVTPTLKKAYPIDVNNLEETVFQFRTVLSSPQYDPRPVAEKLYNAIFRQPSAGKKTTLEHDLEELLGKYPEKNLMWSLDGVLRYIPMAALYDGSSYLIEKYQNIVFTGESLPWLLKTPPAKTQALGLGVSQGNPGLELAPLPGVQREMTDVIKQTGENTGILSGIRKLNDQFKRQEIENLKNENNQFGVVHIASHYSFNPTDQNKSFLLIGDGKLTFEDLKSEENIFRSVDLLTLSACDTAMSANGKESEGFAYLAQRLGAKSVLASLWKVSDVGTPKLMVSFYKFRAEQPAMTKGEAFRQAQLSLLLGNKAQPKSNPPPQPGSLRSVKIEGRTIQLSLFQRDPQNPFAHPFYWASFVLIGNWR
jgi:CHAT domain-containing protein/Tfp pilus assembly protein PilF